MSSWEGLWMRFYRDDDESKKMRQWLTGYRLQAWGTTLRELGQDEGLAGPMSDYFQEDRRRRHLVYEDVVPCLEQLSGRYKLGLLTNGVVDLQQEKIDGSKLGPYFDAQVISGEIDVGKPDKRVFDLALDRLELNASQVVMVGNSLTSDIAGGKGAGIRSIWLNRTGEANSGDIRPDATIAALDDLDRHLA